MKDWDLAMHFCQWERNFTQYLNETLGSDQKLGWENAFLHVPTLENSPYISIVLQKDTFISEYVI